MQTNQLQLGSAIQSLRIAHATRLTADDILEYDPFGDDEPTPAPRTFHAAKPQTIEEQEAEILLMWQVQDAMERGLSPEFILTEVAA